MKAALHILRPGENVAIKVIDFDGDLDRLLRPYFDGEDFEHNVVLKGDVRVDRFTATGAPDGIAVLIEGIEWDGGVLEPRHYRPDYEGEN